MFVCSYGAKNHLNTRKGKTHMKENTLLTIYGARISKSGKHINLTLVSGEGDQKQFYTACVKIDEDAKTHGSIEDNKAIIVVPMLKQEKAEADEMTEEDLPF